MSEYTKGIQRIDKSKNKNYNDEMKKKDKTMIYKQEWQREPSGASYWSMSGTSRVTPVSGNDISLEQDEPDVWHEAMRCQYIWIL